MEEKTEETTIANDVIRGVPAIAAFIGEDEHRTYRLCAGRIIPCGKQGASWIASKRALRAHYARLTGAEAA
jgi:hypothetical protein